MLETDSQREPATKRKQINKANSVVIIKPRDAENDKRTNDAIKADLLEKLKACEKTKKLRIKGIKQLRKGGILMEVGNKEDVELINKINLKKRDLRIR